MQILFQPNHRDQDKNAHENKNSTHPSHIHSSNKIDKYIRSENSFKINKVNSLVVSIHGHNIPVKEVVLSQNISLTVTVVISI